MNLTVPKLTVMSISAALLFGSAAFLLPTSDENSIETLEWRVLDNSKCDFDFSRHRFFSNFSLETCFKVSRNMNWVILRNNDKNYRYKIAFYVKDISDFDKGIIIRIIGGPGGRSLFPDFGTKFTKKLDNISQSCGFPIVRFSYTGTMENQQFPKPGFDAAIADFEHLAAKAHKAYDDENVLVFADSLGGHILLASSKPLSMKALILNPLLVSPKNWIENVDQNYSTEEQIKQGDVTIRMPSGKYKKISAYSLKKSFFDLNSANYSKNAFDHLRVYNNNFDNINIIHNPNGFINAGKDVVSISNDISNKLQYLGVNIYDFNIPHTVDNFSFELIESRLSILERDLCHKTP